MMNSQKHLESGNRAASDKQAEIAREAERVSRFHRASWKEALGKIVSPALRLHNYRQVHNRLLQNALCELDSDDSGECGA